MNRRQFLHHSSQAAVGGLLLPNFSWPMQKDLFFKISLAEWSLRDPIRSGEISNMDFPEVARKFYGIEAVEYVSTFFDNKEKDQAYLKELKQRSDDLGVRNVLIMVDLWDYKTASPDKAARKKAVEMHKPWVDAAKLLGCHAIRINANGYDELGPEAASDVFAESFADICDYAKPMNLNIVLENHGGYSSNGQWIAGLMKKVKRDNAGTLPDFGNLNISKTEKYDMYRLVEETLPYAKGVSAKSMRFNAKGEEAEMDYTRLLKLIKKSGFSGYIGIEFGGELSKMDKNDGVMLTKRLLERTAAQLS